MEQGWVSDGTVAQDGAQMDAVWNIRESITSALSRDGFVYKYDVSLPLVDFYNLVRACCLCAILHQ